MDARHETIVLKARDLLGCKIVAWFFDFPSIPAILNARWAIEHAPMCLNSPTWSWTLASLQTGSEIC